MLEQYGFLCDCAACSLTGERRRENNEARGLVLRMDTLIEKYLYDFEDEQSKCDTATDILHDLEMNSIPGLGDLNNQDEDIKDVISAVKLLFFKLSLMDSLGFKVVSQASHIVINTQLIYKDIV